jgi:putative PEP-CTERM system integral membrane protein
VSDTTLSLALLIDTSFSMMAIKERLTVTLDSLKELSQHSNVTIDFYILADDLKPISDKQLNELFLFGYSSTVKQLKQWQQSDYAKQSYDALLVLTDQGNYESSEEIALNRDKKVPLWIVHLGEQPAHAYGDNLLSRIYQSGGITDTIHEAITRVIWQKQMGITETAQMSEHYLWAYSWSDGVTKPTQNERLSAIVAHQWITANFNQRLDNGAEQVTHLDDLHYLAKRYSLVSPFSSMMVLVNKRQEEALSKLSTGDDRFERSVETGKKSIIKGGNLFAISSVPEPEEWALLMVVFLILSGHLIRKNQLKRKLFA